MESEADVRMRGENATERRKRLDRSGKARPKGYANHQDNWLES